MRSSGPAQQRFIDVIHVGQVGGEDDLAALRPHESDVLPSTSFSAFGQAISELLDRLAVGPRYIYRHDFGAPVGFHIAMQALPRMEAHVFDAGHLMLETHAAQAAALMLDFIDVQ